MLARRDGQVALVAGAIPGERVTAVVERVNRQVIWATVDRVAEPSPHRRPSSVDPACGGLSYGHIEYPHQLALKGQVIADAFRRIGKLPLGAAPEIAASPETGYRLRARLHVRQGRAGFFREGTHSLCDAAATGQLAPTAMAAADATVRALASRVAECESLIVAETVRRDARVVHLVGHPGARLRDLATRLTLPDDVRGVTTDTGEGVVTLAGDPAVVDTADALGMEKTDPALATRPLSWTRRAASFFQGNRYLVGALARRVAELAGSERVADFYSGVGLFALMLAARGARVVAVEGDPVSGEDLEANAADWGDRVDVVRAAVESVLDETPSTPPDVVVVDPPRSGLSPQATAGVIRWNAPRVVYVSCDPPTLARDAALLVKAGYQLRSLEGFDFFPNTPHVETLAVFDQRP